MRPFKAVAKRRDHHGSFFDFCSPEKKAEHDIAWRFRSVFRSHTDQLAGDRSAGLLDGGGCFLGRELGPLERGHPWTALGATHRGWLITSVDDDALIYWPETFRVEIQRCEDELGEEKQT